MWIAVIAAAYMVAAASQFVWSFEILFDDAGANIGGFIGFKLGISGRHIVASVYDFNSLGGVVVYTESILGANDWYDNAPTVLTHEDSATGETFGISCAIDGVHVVAGAPIFNVDVIGYIVIWTATSESALDWQDTRVRIDAPSGAVSNSLFGEHVAVKDGIVVASDWMTNRVSIFTESVVNAQDWANNVVHISGSGQYARSTQPFVILGNHIYIGTQKLERVDIVTQSSPEAHDWDLNGKVSVLQPGGTVSQNGFGTAVQAFEDDITGITTLGISSWAYYYTGKTGSVYIFVESSAGAADWGDSTHVATLQGNSDTENGYGVSFAFAGRTVAIGSYDLGIVDVFKETSDGALDWTLTETINQYGCGDLGTMIVGRASYGAGDTIIADCYGKNTFTVHLLCPGLDRYAPCDCTDTNSIGVYCTEPCENSTPEYTPTETLNGFPIWTQCDCSGANAFASKCSNVCYFGTQSAAPSFDQCDCTGLNTITQSCEKSCNHGFVVDDSTFSQCNCSESGASGKYCQKDIDDCESSPCMNAGVCVDDGAVWFPNFANQYNCSCNGTGYHGTSCDISDCISSPCLNDGVCQQAYDHSDELTIPSGIQCNCSGTGYEGNWCQTEIDECASSPCLNDGVCTDDFRSFSCDCTGTGYQGLTCSDDFDDCLSSPCQNDGVCQDKGTNKFKCTCDEFWEGGTCADNVDDCILKGYYCENGAACSDDPVNLGDVTCDCSISEGGFTGKYCDVPVENACVTFNPCFNGGKCILDDITNAMSCDCANTGYEGDVCDVLAYVSECVSSPCLNEGQCYDPSDDDGDWYCECTTGYTGDICDFRACDSMPCENGGTCTNDEIGDYTCSCAENYAGAQCQVLDDAAQVGSSSSSVDTGNDEAAEPDIDKKKNKANDGTVAIIIIVLVLVIAAASGLYIYSKKNQSEKTFAMPT